MAEPMTTRSLKDILLFPFREPNWRGRFLIGAALVLAGYVIPILPLIFVVGYTLQIMRRVALGEDPTLLPWDEWGRFAVDGLRGMLVGLVYLLPGILVLTVGMGLYMFTSMSGPFMNQGGVSTYGGEEVWVVSFLASMAIMFLSMCLGTALLTVGAVPLPVALTHFAVQDKVSAAFRPREWWPQVRANAGSYFVVWVVGVGLGTMLYFAQMLVGYSVILCCLVPFVSAAGGFYLSLVAAALFGQFYRESAGQPAPDEPVLLFDEDFGEDVGNVDRAPAAGGEPAGLD
jgi:hypothetical protein